MKSTESAENFLKKMHMHHEQLNMEKICNHFIQEMDRGLKGEKSSLHMIPTYIESPKEIPIEEKVIVLDAGGTNFRVALAHFDKSQVIQLEHFKSFPMPGSLNPLSSKDFFNALVNAFEDLLGLSHRIGFCFSYPTEIMSDKDGKLLKFCKEVEAPEVEGMLIGQHIKKVIRERGHTEDYHLVLLNDTVATLLTGQARNPPKQYSSYMGFILGTGLNSAYSELNTNISKLDFSEYQLKMSQIVNTESGRYELKDRGVIDKNYDLKTKEPGTSFLEKMSSGAYFGNLICIVIKKACEEGIFSSEFVHSFASIKKLSTKEVNDFLINPFLEEGVFSKLFYCQENEDREILYSLIDSLLQRSAKVVAINLSALFVKSGSGKNPLHPICLTIDGTTFYAYYHFQMRVENYLNGYFNNDRRYYEIIKVKDAPLIGAAIAVLTN